MIGDDEVLMRMVETTVTAAYPEMEVVSAMGGARGMQMLDEPGQQFDLVMLTTLRLMDLSSYEVLEHLRKMHASVKVLVFSGGPIPPDTLPMHAFLPKPVHPKVLARAVGRLVAM